MKKKKLDEKFSKARKGYNRDEVDTFVNESAQVNATLRGRIEELEKKLTESESQLSQLRQKQDLILHSIMGATQKAEQIENLTRQKYEFDMAQLRSFHDRWTDYYNKLIAKFPLDSQLKGLNTFNRNMNKLLGGEEKLYGKLMSQIDKEMTTAQAQFMRESARLSDLDTEDEEMDGIPIFNPEETIRGLIRRQLDEESAKDKPSKSAKPTPKTPTKSIKSDKDKSDKEKSDKEKSDKDKADKSQKPTFKPSKSTKSSKSAPTPTHDSNNNPNDDSDEASMIISEGFSYEEAMNPKQELSQILKDLGLDLD